MVKIQQAYIIFASVVLFASCKKASHPNDENEHEAINKVELVFTRQGAAAATFVIEDPDGDGGNPPTRIDTIRLAPNQTHSLEVRIKNIVSGRETDLTPSILSQGISHELFFLPSGVAVTITKTDTDAKGYPIGIRSTWAAGPVGTGSVMLKLMHKPGIKGPSDAATLGQTDLQIVIPCRIQN